MTRAGLRQINGAGRPAVFYLHPWELDPDQPRVAAGWLSRFRHYNNLEKFEPRLRQLLRDFPFTAMWDVLKGAGLIDEGHSSVPLQRPATRPG